MEQAFFHRLEKFNMLSLRDRLFCRSIQRKLLCRNTKTKSTRTHISWLRAFSMFKTNSGRMLRIISLLYFVPEIGIRWQIKRVSWQLKCLNDTVWLCNHFQGIRSETDLSSIWCFLWRFHEYSGHSWLSHEGLFVPLLSVECIRINVKQILFFFSIMPFKWAVEMGWKNPLQHTKYIFEYTYDFIVAGLFGFRWASFADGVSQCHSTEDVLQQRGCPSHLDSSILFKISLWKWVGNE